MSPTVTLIVTGRPRIVLKDPLETAGTGHLPNSHLPAKKKSLVESSSFNYTEIQVSNYTGVQGIQVEMQKLCFLLSDRLLKDFTGKNVHDGITFYIFYNISKESNQFLCLSIDYQCDDTKNLTYRLNLTCSHKI